MPDPERLSQNLERWISFCPNEAKEIASMQTGSVSLIEINGNKNLQKNTDGNVFLYHDAENPMEEARRAFDALNLKNVHVIYVWGVGLGYFYRAAKEWLKQSDERSVVFLEDDLSVLRCLFETEEGTDILQDSQVWLYFLDPHYAILDLLSSLFVLRSYRVTALEAYAKSKTDRFFGLKSKITFWSNFKHSGTFEYKDFGVGFLRNFYHNLLRLPDALSGNRLYSRFAGIPAIICGAGPSLEKNLHVLEKLKDRALIFAGGTSMNAINADGFVPHFGVGIDPNPDQFARLITNISYVTPYFYRNRLNNEGLRLIHGDHLYVTGAGGYDIAKWVENKLDIHGKDVSEGHNVINFSLSVAAEMGCNPIILVGVDLAYSNDASYAPGVLNHPIHNRHRHFKTKDLDEELIVKKDIYGEDVYTLWKWVSESLWFANYAASNPGISLINATEGGLGFSGVPNIPLEEAAEKFLQKRFDFAGLVHGELQNCPMPDSVTPRSLEGVLTGLRESLKNTVSLLRNIRNELETVLHEYAEGKTPPPSFMNEQASTYLDLLHKEEVYGALLVTFEKAYRRITLRQSRRLSLDEEIAGEKKIIEGKLRLLIDQYQFVYDTARFNIGLIDEVLDEIDVKRQIAEAWKKHEGKKPPVSEPEDTSIYAFDGKRLKIRDEELGLAYDEPFEPGAPTEWRDPQGVLRMENYYKNEALHGPSVYYNADGKVLSRTWFLDGLRQGKARYYHTIGSLASLQRFKDGHLEGRQEYYYGDGKTRALIHYRNGRLHGDVLLYSPLGRIKREIHFVEGKREGIERIHNDQGLMVIEAGYHDGLPVGRARRWFDNGNISREIIYDEKGISLSESKWTIDGVPLSKVEAADDDYFDRVTKETGILTKTLGDVLTQVSTFAPLIMKYSGVTDEDQAAKDVKTDLMNLNIEMENLRQLSKEILMESGIDTVNQREPIWKSEATRHLMEDQINEMTFKLREELNSIKDNLLKSMQDFTKESKKD